MTICVLGRSLQFAVCLSKQVFGASRVAAHIEFVGLLRGVNPADGLINQPLGSGEIRMAVGVNVLGDSNAACEKAKAKSAAENHVASFHAKSLRPINISVEGEGRESEITA
jgi:hypothetical protein